LKPGRKERIVTRQDTAPEPAMNIQLSDAAPRLNELVADVEAGEEVVLMRGGRPVARITQVGTPSVADGTVPDGSGFDVDAFRRHHATLTYPAGPEPALTVAQMRAQGLMDRSF
jgi:prevent-host-death family protein